MLLIVSGHVTFESVTDIRIGRGGDSNTEIDLVPQQVNKVSILQCNKRCLSIIDAARGVYTLGCWCRSICDRGQVSQRTTPRNYSTVGRCGPSKINSREETKNSNPTIDNYKVSAPNSGHSLHPVLFLRTASMEIRYLSVTGLLINQCI